MHATRYYQPTIVSFKDADTERLVQGNRVREIVDYH
jgi:hypothetical protein